MTSELRPYGAWPSRLDAKQVAAAALRLSLPQLDRGAVHWLEGRPAEAGRQALVRAAPGEAPRELTPPGSNTRSRVHEYGGGDYLVREGACFRVEFGTPGIVFAEVAGASERPVPGTLAGARYADFALSPDARFLVAVEEQPGAGRQPANRLVAFDLERGVRRVLDAEHDFVSSPVFAPDGERLAWLAWDHPNLPWDGTTLQVVGFASDGPRGEPRAVAGGATESIFQPAFSPAGALTFVSDRSGFWNLHQERAGGVVALAPRQAEFGRAQWALGMRTYAFAGEGRILCARREIDGERLAWLDTESRELEDLPLPFNAFDGVVCDGRQAAFIAAGPLQAPAVGRLDLASGTWEELRGAFRLEGAPAAWSEPEPLTFAGSDAAPVHAFLYRPRNSEVRAPEGTRPPLLVQIHGGPTGAARPQLAPGVQYWTTRGFAVVDVDYGGSSGYGRAYRERLRGRWGELDVEDATRAALHLVERGLVDPARLAIRGGSAGGYTVLCALASCEVFAAGASHYGVGDLEALQESTHKFEACYLEGLIGPWPARRDLYRLRSPVHHAARIRAPAIFFQGSEDFVVPPAQAEIMVAALRARGIPCEHHVFAGEGHGFRRAESLVRALEAELAFYARHLGGTLPRP